MKIKEIINRYDLNSSLIFGYYGGGNYGDELLLEVLLTAFDEANVKDVSYMYQRPALHDRYHARRPGRKRITSKFGLLAQMLKSRNIIMGGGGHWGLDMNFNVFILSIAFFIARFLFRKKIYLVGVGYYGSTNRLGHASAWLVAKSAEVIFARDEETYHNFSAFSTRTVRGEDIAFSIPTLDLSQFKSEAEALEQRLKITEYPKTVIISLRRLSPSKGEPFQRAIKEIIARDPETHFVLTYLEPREHLPDEYRRIDELARKNKRVDILDNDFNPLAFYEMLRRHADRIRLVAIQYHGQLVAHLAGARHYPVIYDNKVDELLKQFAIEPRVKVENVTLPGLEGFIYAEEETAA